MLGCETLPSLLRAAAEEFGEHPAYVEGDSSLSYAGLLDRVRGVATAYVDSGLEPGDRVAIWAPNSTDWAVAALAVTYAGGQLVPLNSRYTAHEVAEVLARVDARVVVVADGFLGGTQIEDLEATGTTARLVNLAELPRAHGDLDIVVTPDDVADILFTSGTTGRSKGATSAHRQTIGVARAWAELGGIQSDDRYLVVNPFFHSFGYKIGIVVGLLTGCTLYPVATFDVTETMRLIEDARITVLPGAPTIYQSLLAADDRADHDLSSLRLAVTGAASVPVVLIERMREELHIDQVVTAFGMTEAVVVTMCRPDDDAETVATTNGRAIPGMELRMGPGDELLVRGDFVMLGYLDDPTATAEAIDADGWLHTGDVGAIDERGNLRITDRLKDMYICGGFNVYPAEVEQTICRLDGVVESAVVGVPDERLGEVGRAFVVRRGDSPSEGEVLAWCGERLANFKRPRSVVFVESLPRNLSGKVMKTELRDE